MRQKPSILRLFRRDASKTRLDQLLDFAPADGPREEGVLWFVRLVEWLRPRAGESVNARVRFLETRLAADAEARERVSRTVTRLLEETALAAFFASGGIPHDFHFGGALKEWLFANVLPAACRTDDGAEVLRLSLREGDLEWLRRSRIVEVLRDLVAPEARQNAANALGEALGDLTHQIVAQAHLPGVRALAPGERSPFRGLHDAVAALVKEPDSDAACAAVRGRARQCLAALDARRAELSERGADLTTTFLLARSAQQLRRLSLLAGLLHEPTSLPDAAPELAGRVLRHARGHRLIERGTDLVTQNLIDTAAGVGRAYLGDGDGECTFRGAFLAGAGGGFLMALTTLVKYAILRLHMPVFYEGVASSLNYAAVFCAAYLLHYTIATKLPANTAATLARSAQDGAGLRKRLGAFVSVWRSALRLQLAGLLGNVAVAGPFALLLALGTRAVFHHDILDAEEASHALHANSVLGPSVLYAALAGVILWIGSLVGAAADNWTRVVRAADRLGTSRLWMERLGAERAHALAERLVSRWGGLVGNAAVGFMLGGIPAAFAIVHLPVEIRHITVSTSSVALAIGTWTQSARSIWLAILGLLVIAFTNVAVSFVTALWFAMRGVRSSPTSAAIVKIGLRRWARGLFSRPRSPQWERSTNNA